MTEIVLTEYSWFLPGTAILLIISIVSPFFSLLIFAASLPFEASVVLVTGFSVSKVAGIIMAISWICNVIFRRGRIYINPFCNQLFLYLCWTGAGLIYQNMVHADSLELAAFNSLWQCFMLVFIITNLIHTYDEFMLFAGILAGSLIASFMLSNVYSSDEILLSGRLALLGADQNESAFFCGAIFLMMGVISQKSKSMVRKMFAGAIALIMVILLLLTGSRGGLVAFMISVMVCVLFGQFGKKNKSVIFMLMLGLLIAYRLLIEISFPLPQAFEAYEKGVKRLQEFVTREENSLETLRTEIWEQGWKRVKEKPILGYGFGSFEKFIDMAPHNDFLRVLFETGLIGLIIFTMIYCSSFLRAINRKEFMFPGYGPAMLSLCFISSLFLGLLTVKIFWISFSSCWLSLQVVDKKSKVVNGSRSE